MAGATITITVDDAEVRAAINRLAMAGADMSAPFKNVAQKMLDSTRARFATQASPDGTPWAPISEAWKKRKKKLGGYPEILAFRGNLLGVSTATTLACFSTPTSAMVGSKLPYAAIMQFGGTIAHEARSRMVSWKVIKRRDGNWADGVRYDWKFARPSKANFERRVDFGAFAQTIVARPWLGLSRDDRTRIIEIFSDFFGQAAGGTHAV